MSKLAMMICGAFLAVAAVSLATELVIAIELVTIALMCIELKCFHDQRFNPLQPA